MKPHTTYKIYPKAISEFINDNYNLDNINFGNIKNNVIAILQKLNIDNTLDAKWEITPLYFFDKVNISKNDNKPTDFDEYSNFKFTFNLKDGKSNGDYEKSIQKLESNFITKYQNRLDLEHQELKKQLQIKKNKAEKMIYLFTALSFIILIVAIYFLKKG